MNEMGPAPPATCHHRKTTLRAPVESPRGCSGALGVFCAHEAGRGRVLCSDRSTLPHPQAREPLEPSVGVLPFTKSPCIQAGRLATPWLVATAYLLPPLLCST